VIKACYNNGQKERLCLIIVPSITLSTKPYFPPDLQNKMKNKKYHTAKTVPKSNRKIVEKAANLIPLTLVCLIIDKCRHQKLCKRVQKISAAAPLRVMASRYNPCE
jgi:hypothetical protein